MSQDVDINVEETVSFNLSEKDIERFHSKYSKHAAQNCWNWKAGCFSTGYPAFKVNGKTVHGNRVAYFLGNGPLEKGKVVRHSCDNPKCVNPFHLLIGSHQDNMRDMVERGRSAKGNKNGTRLYPERLKRGEDHPGFNNPGMYHRGDEHWTHKKPELLKRGSDHGSAKLNEEKVLAIRAKFAAGGVSKAALGREYGVNECMIGFIIRREKWTHI
jgi:hypothetical protein